MAESSLRSATVAKVAFKLSEITGRPTNRDELAPLLERCFSAYEDYRLRSRDELPTVAQLSTRTAEIKGHLDAVTELLDPFLVGWLDNFMKDRGVDEPGAFFQLYEHAAAAREAARFFQDAVDAGSPITISMSDGTPINHVRNTRTDARDTMLIPLLLVILRGQGMDLKSARASWDLEAVDAACDIIKTLLGDRNIPVPTAGNTDRGEENQGRLRILIKRAWDNPPIPVDK